MTANGSPPVGNTPSHFDWKSALSLPHFLARSAYHHGWMSMSCSRWEIGSPVKLGVSFAPTWMTFHPDVDRHTSSNSPGPSGLPMTRIRECSFAASVEAASQMFLGMPYA